MRAAPPSPARAQGAQRPSTSKGEARERSERGWGPILFDGIDHPLRLTQAATTTTAYYELDLAGNVRHLFASGGSDLGGYRYTAFGKTVEDTTTITQPLRWKGRWWSSVAGGIHDVRARQWAPELGVFLVIDDIDGSSTSVDPLAAMNGGAEEIGADVLAHASAMSLTRGIRRARSFGFHDTSATLWAWPGQSPSRSIDPSGRAACDGRDPDWKRNKYNTCITKCFLAAAVCYYIKHYTADFCGQLYTNCITACGPDPGLPN